MRFHENGAMTIYRAKNPLGLHDSYDEGLGYYYYDVSPMLIHYVLGWLLFIWFIYWRLFYVCDDYAYEYVVVPYPYVLRGLTIRPDLMMLC